MADDTGQTNPQLLPWINASGQDGLRNSMQSFQGDGSTTEFEFNFSGGYINRSDVKAYIYDSTSGLTSDYTLDDTNFTGTNTIVCTPALPDTKYLVVYRDTQKTVPLVDYSTNAVMNESNLDTSNKQAIFVAAEMVDRFDAINASSADAVTRSFTALTTANEAKTEADAAVTTATAANATSTAAKAEIDTAVDTANAASAAANAIAGQATEALSNSETAVSTANDAKTTADGIAGTANTALSNSETAVSTAATAATAAGTSVTPSTYLPDTNVQDALTRIASSPLGLRNKIINGNMRISQRATSFPAASGYTLDMWKYLASSDAVCTVSRNADQPFISTLLVTVTTADTSIGAAEYSLIRQPIEGLNVVDLIGRSFVVAFDVRSSKTGTYYVALRNTSADKSYVVPFTINTANTLEHKYFIVSDGLPTDGTWDWGTGLGLSVDFILAAGSDHATETLNEWLDGNYSNGNDQVNFLDTVGATFAITNVQLFAGAADAPFEARPIGVEQSLVERSFEIVSLSRWNGVLFVPNGDVRFGIIFKTLKRTAPTLINKSGDVGAIAVGDVGSVINISLGTLGMVADSRSMQIISASNASAFSSCGNVIAFGAGNGLVVWIDAGL